MKLLIVTAIQENQRAVAHIFDHNGIKKYSVTNIYGVSNEQEASPFDNWFGSPENEDLFQSVMLFSFTEDYIARKTLEELAAYNLDKQPVFPIRALILPVEQSI